jgi:hypothetical protein
MTDDRILAGREAAEYLREHPELMDAPLPEVIPMVRRAILAPAPPPECNASDNGKHEVCTALECSAVAKHCRWCAEEMGDLCD